MVAIDAEFELEYSNEIEFYKTLHRRTRPGCDAVGLYGTAIRPCFVWRRNYIGCQVIMCCVPGIIPYGKKIRSY